MACPTVGSQHEAGQRVGDIAQIVTRPDNQISPLTRLEQTGVVEAETACAPSGRHFHDVDRHERVRAQLAEPGRVERLAEFREEAAYLVGCDAVDTEADGAAGSPQIGDTAHACSYPGV